jgi:translation initiation factor IF-3
LGIKTLPEALNIARAADMDLVEVADKASPPVCRIMNYSKYKFEEQQRAKESRRKSTNIVIKEMKYRPKIGDGDFGTKTKKVEGFLSDGHKVKVTIMFRGREMQHPELGRKILDRIADEVIEVGKVEVMPRQDGRNMTMVLGPDKRAQQATAKRLAEEGLEAEAAETDTELPTAAAPEADQPEAQLEAVQPEAIEPEAVEAEAATPEAVPAETQDH